MVTKVPAESPISLMHYEYDDTTIFFFQKSSIVVSSV